MSTGTLELDILQIAIRHITARYVPHTKTAPPPDTPQYSLLIERINKLIEVKPKIYIPYMPSQIENSFEAYIRMLSSLIIDYLYKVKFTLPKPQY